MTTGNPTNHHPNHNLNNKSQKSPKVLSKWSQQPTVMIFHQLCDIVIYTQYMYGQHNLRCNTRHIHILQYICTVRPIWQWTHAHNDYSSSPVARRCVSAKCFCRSAALVMTGRVKATVSSSPSWAHMYGIGREDCTMLDRGGHEGGLFSLQKMSRSSA